MGAKLTTGEIRALANVKSVYDQGVDGDGDSGRYCDPLFYFHYMPNGKVKYQGYVSKLTKDGCGVATLFSFLSGYETDTFTFTKMFLNKCVIYASNYEMRIAYENMQEQKDVKENA